MGRQRLRTAQKAKTKDKGPKVEARGWLRRCVGSQQSEAAHTRAGPRPPGESDKGLLCLCFDNRTDAFTVGRAGASTATPAGSSPAVASQAPFAAAHRPCIVVASLVAEPGLWGAWASVVVPEGL